MIVLIAYFIGLGSPVVSVCDLTMKLTKKHWLLEADVSCRAVRMNFSFCFPCQCLFGTHFVLIVVTKTDTLNILHASSGGSRLLMKLVKIPGTMK